MFVRSCVGSVAREPFVWMLLQYVIMSSKFKSVATYNIWAWCSGVIVSTATQTHTQLATFYTYNGNVGKPHICELQCVRLAFGYHWYSFVQWFRSTTTTKLRKMGGNVGIVVNMLKMSCQRTIWNEFGQLRRFPCVPPRRVCNRTLAQSATSFILIDSGYAVIVNNMNKQ